MYEARLIDQLSFNTADLVDEVSENEIYFGWFRPGKTDLTATHCRICRLTKSGTVYTRNWADGNREYDNIWNNRATLTYSFLL